MVINPRNSGNSFARPLVDIEGGLMFAKNPKWSGQELLFLDIHDRCIKSTDMSGVVKTVEALPFLPGSLELLDGQALVVGDTWQRKLHHYGSAGQSQLTDLSCIARVCLSDLVRDNRGGMYVGDIGYDFLDPSVDPVPRGLIIRISAQAELSIVADNLLSPHGMIITPDNQTLIVAETQGHRLTAFDIDKAGSLKNRRVWAQFQTDVWPDGICFDLDGAIWVASSGPTALRVVEGGEIDQLIVTKRAVFDTALGGPERKHLFMCTSASNDPVMTRRNPDATIDVVEVEIPGTGMV